MSANVAWSRRLLLTSAALLVAAALVVAAGVIPPVRADTFPGATPQRALPAFWVNVAVSLVAAGLLTLIALRAPHRGPRAATRLGLVAFLALLLALALSDAGFACRAHGPAMQTASALLLTCAAADALAAVLAIAAAFVLPKQT